MEITDDNYLSLVIENLALLKNALANDEISSMLFDGDEEDKIEELADLVGYLEKTN